MRRGGNSDSGRVVKGGSGGIGGVGVRGIGCGRRSSGGKERCSTAGGGVVLVYIVCTFEGAIVVV